MTAASTDRCLAFFDPLLGRAALVVERHDALSWPHQVDYNEPDARIKLTWIPLDFRHHSARLRPALRLIADTGIIAAHLMRRPPNPSLEQIIQSFAEDPCWLAAGSCSPCLRFRGIRRPPGWRRPRRYGNSAASPYLGSGRSLAPTPHAWRRPSAHSPAETHRSRSPSWLNTNGGW